MIDKFNQDGTISENWLVEEITQRKINKLDALIDGQNKHILQLETIKDTIGVLAEIRDELVDERNEEGINAFDALMDEYMKIK